jgi:hypothetical protein
MLADVAEALARGIYQHQVITTGRQASSERKTCITGRARRLRGLLADPRRQLGRCGSWQARLSPRVERSQRLR